MSSVYSNRLKWLLIVYCYLVFQPAEVLAQYCPAKEPITYRGITLRVENDSFANTDHNYTHGFAFTAESHDLKIPFEDECSPWPLRRHAQLFKFLTPEFWIDHQNPLPPGNFVMKLGQSIYTPTDRSRSDVILDDRPYAGLLYAGLSHHQRHRHPSGLEVLDMREITLGVIGPLSFAKEFQDFVHNIDGDGRFQGWGNQLTNEPAFQVALDKKFKQYRGPGPVLEGFAADFIDSVGIRIGNIETSANIGFEGRIGWNIPNDFGSLTIRPGSDSHPPDISPEKNAISPQPRFGFHFFAIFDLRYVAYNFSVDGNLFQPSHHVTRQPWVGLGAAGLSFPTILKKHRYTFAIMQAYQTSDFKEQNAHQAYRAVALSIDY